MIKTLVIAALLATGVSVPLAAQSLVGKWDCDARDGPKTAIRTLMHYRASGQFNHLANVAAGDRRGRIDAAIALRGTWKLQGNKVVEQIKTARMRSISANGQDISKTPLGRQMGKTLPRQLGAGGRDSITRIKFITADKYELQGRRVNGICTRR